MGCQRFDTRWGSDSMQPSLVAPDVTVRRWLTDSSQLDPKHVRAHDLTEGHT